MDRRQTNYYLDIAETVLERGTCIRRKFGAIIVKNDEIISSGYVGAPRGRKLQRLGLLHKRKLNIPKGQRYELCRSVHAEANAIIASRRDLIGSTLYLACHDAKTNELYGDVEPCSMCKRLIINAGIERVVVRTSKNEYKTFDVETWIENDESINGTEGY